MPTINLPKKRYEGVRTTRKVSYQKVYQDRRYRLLREAKLNDNPLCERCASKGIVRQAEEVHHSIPFDWGRTEHERDMLAFDYSNLQSVCGKCHDEAHAWLEEHKDEIIAGFDKCY